MKVTSKQLLLDITNLSSDCGRDNSNDNNILAIVIEMIILAPSILSWP